jgi:predicted nucleic acid-binding protein
MYIQHAETLAEPTTNAKLPSCRDPNDLIFLRLAYAANADALVSGDADLLAVSARSRVPVITPEKLKKSWKRSDGSPAMERLHRAYRGSVCLATPIS